MKKFLFITFMALSASTFANTVTKFNFDDVDSVISNGKALSVEDLRDGFATITGVSVNENTVSITEKSNALILLRNSNKFLQFTTMGSRLSGGDGGGG
jgi:hypothetical protein